MFVALLNFYSVQKKWHNLTLVSVRRWEVVQSTLQSAVLQTLQVQLRCVQFSTRFSLDFQSSRKRFSSFSVEPCQEEQRITSLAENEVCYRSEETGEDVYVNEVSPGENSCRSAYIEHSRGKV